MEETPSSSSSRNTFSQFRRLPVELRIQIWEHALSAATSGRTIRVSIHQLSLITMHSCHAVGFCGKRKSCDRFRPDSGENFDVVFAMADGYFATHGDFPDPVSHCSMQNLSLACRASREVVLSQYGRVLRIHRHKGCPGSASRMVRYNPWTDLLLATAWESKSLAYNYPNDLKDQVASYRTQQFTRDLSSFPLFRDALSSFRRVAFLYSVPKDGLDDNRGELMYDSDFKWLLLFLESLQHLYVWPNPSLWPEAHEDGAIMLHDMQKFWPMYYGHDFMPHVVGEASTILSAYTKLWKVQTDRFTPCDDEWVPLPKPIESIGCYAAKAWVPKSTVNGNE